MSEPRDRWVRVEFYGLLPAGQVLVDLCTGEVANTLGKAFGFRYVGNLTVAQHTAEQIEERWPGMGELVRAALERGEFVVQPGPDDTGEAAFLADLLHMPLAEPRGLIQQVAADLEAAGATSIDYAPRPDPEPGKGEGAL